ncbi:cytoplasmic dynein 2 heavy chain 1-like isoform X1 [Acanthaster planci]|uniref:Cytoplasmic dynein 2 heavy chain 1 n=1 Tax=Acanthaster planci TaxID=133434 RepID=A0A8B7ZBN6_ACAPL|nr:cytoplasmic dynein 2 heavy chain 1-like isoform X1 [Acanthaster planci]
MPSVDVRKDFLLGSCASFFDIPSGDGVISHLFNAKELNTFLDDANCSVLSAKVNSLGNERKVLLSNKVDPSETGEKVLSFFKVRPNVISQDNVYSDIFCLSMLDSPCSALYHAVDKVYAPLLIKDEKWSRTLDPKLQNLLTEFQAGLQSLIRKIDPSQAGKVVRDDSNFAGILTPSDEFQYWAEVAISGTKLETKERAQLFQQYFEPITRDYNNLDALSLAEGLDLVETTQDALDDVWKQGEFDPYPEKRMKHFIEVIGSSLGRYAQRKLSVFKLWEDPYHRVKESLTQAIAICDKWVASCERLTEQFWKRDPIHPWKSSKFAPEGLVQLSARLQEIATLRTVHEQLARLLSTGEQHELRTADAFTHFRGLNALQYNPYTEPMWRAAVTQYHRAMAPAEQRIAGKLRSQLRNLEASPQQLLREFLKNKELVSREGVRKELVSERETLLGQLQVYLKTIKDDFNTRITDTSPPTGKNLPEVVNNIVWVRQLEAKVEETSSVAEALLKDLSGFSRFRRSAGDLVDELRNWRQEQFDNWSREMLAAIEDPKKPLSLQMSGRLMEFDTKNQELKVSYSERLVTLIREVRQLQALGYPVAAKIQHTAAIAQKFYKHGVILKQVAHFHNTIAEQMIPSQRNMMLQSALAFERMIKKPKTGAKDGGGGKVQITWDNPEELEAYIVKLRAAAEKLTTENRRLRKWHFTVSDKVIQLMSVDLLRQQPRWKEGLQEIRGIMSTLENQGYKREDMKSWKIHWDWQLYKALEHQYQMGLEALNEHLPEIKVDLTFRQQRLQFRPPLEEIRAKYYREMKKFISLPYHFRGLADPGDNAIFPVLIERHASSFSTVYQKAEDLFDRLANVKKTFKDWVVLGSVDLDKLIEGNLHTVADWERNFKSLKARGRDSEKLPSQIKVDCITVSAAPVKTTIDSLIQRLFDALLSSLRYSITEHINEIDRFLKDSMEALSTRPQTVEEIGKANAKHAELQAKKPEIKPLFEKVEGKNKLLRTVSGGGIEQLSQLHSRWDKFELMMESHELMVKEQVEVMKSNVESRVEAFRADLEKFAARWHQFKPKTDIIETGDRESCSKALTTVKEKKQEFEELEKTRESLVFDCNHFGLDEPHFAVAEELKEDFKQNEAMWALYDEFSNGLRGLEDTEWIVFRSKTYQFDDFLALWAEKLRAEDMEHTMMTVRLTKDVDKYKAVSPMLKYVSSDVYSQEHWHDMFRMLKMPRSTTLEKLTFGDILGAADQIIANSQALKDLFNRAKGEVSIRDALRELDLWGVGATFVLTEYKDSQSEVIMLIKDWKEIVTEVGDNQSLLQSLKDSPYYKGFADKATIWEQRLADLDEFLHNLNQIQRKWVYLEPIFGRGALPKEQGRFKRVDDDFRNIMMDVARDNRVLSLVGRPGLRNTLVALLDQLQRCQKALNEFLEEKRSIFPRFYFIGDDDLLEILGQSTNPVVIQTHLKKLFAGIHSVEFDEGNKNILAMKSLEGEVVPLKSPVQITADVEVWLGELAREMKETLQQLLVECLRAQKGGHGQGVDPNKFPSQILCLANEIQFTEQCESAMKENSLQEYLIELEAQLEGYTSVDIQGNGENDQAMHVLELKLKALILDNIHFIDVVQQLMKDNILSMEEWMWQKQLRFYQADKGKAIMRMVDAEFQYTFEYQGNAAKLVHTPLTDKCYLTLTQGMHMGMGGNPYGPAGTGKTESVKALGGLFGRQVLVFNCDEGIDVKSMGRIFIGLVKCGAWGCFDEFNRLEEAVLSAVSMQIQTIQAALKSKKANCELLDRTIDIDPNSGIFITLNPAGKGYGGRQKLPDNLKQLFRPVAMSRPDNEQIAEVILFSEGFKDGKSLGRKLVAIFNLSKELLTPQQHYDWGLRALKTVLRGSGNLLQIARRQQANGNTNSKIDESKLVVQALRVNTLSKLTFSDSSRFDALVKDVFPGVELKDIEYERLAQSLREICKESNLVIMETQIKKALELYEQLRQRMGVVIVGPSGSGKSTTWQLLRSGLNKTGQVVKQYTMNPKAMPRTQLLGQIDMDTREWSDGVLTYSARQVVREPIEIQSWIICDGDIDPEWIESLNSVLDDNRLLTMPSGERIQFGPNVNFLFETHDLSCASPATISRMGMIFMSDEDTQIKDLVESWLNKLPQERRSSLHGWIDKYFYKALEWVLARTNDFVVETSQVGVVMNGLSHLWGAQDEADFAICLIRGLGGNLKETTRQNFAKEVFHWARENPPDPRRPLDTYYDAGSRRFMNYVVEDNDDLTATDFNKPNSLPVIRTANVQLCLDYFAPWLDPDHRQPFILVGPDGCGKGMILRHCFANLRSTQIATIHCSAQTSPTHVLQKLQQTCMVLSTNTGRVYRPKDCETLVLYLKDLNLPKPDKWGTCQLIAFLQQVLTYRGFYDTNLEWVGLEGVQIVASMNAAHTVGRHQLTSRFTSIVRICSIGYADQDQLQAIYSTYLKAVIHTRLPSHPVWGSVSKISQLARSMLQVYEQTRAKFSIDEHSHYLFTPRDLTQWVLGLLRYDFHSSSSDSTSDQVLEVWAYEAARLFRDKLVSEEGRSRFDSILLGALQSDWNAGHILQSMSGVYYVTWGARAEAGAAGGPLPPVGKSLGKLSSSDLKEVIKRAKVTYARENRDINIQIFREVLEYVAHVDRVLSQPGGSLLMAGCSGVGRRTAVTLVTHCHRMELFTPKMSRNYSMKQFKNDLKGVMQLAGVEGQQVALLLEDHHFSHPQFLELINSLLSAGEIPGLYSPEELEPLLAPIRDQASDEGFRGTLASYFASRILINLHIILIMDCKNSSFTMNCQSNPALYKKCSVQWMEGWSKDSMRELPKMLLRSHPSDSDKKDKGKESKRHRKLSGGDDLIKSFLQIHRSASQHDSTPRRYVTFLHTYMSVYQKKKAGVELRQKHLKAGVSKLNEAKALVAELNRKAAEQSVTLAEKQREADEALKKIQTSMENAGKQRQEIEILKQQADEENQKLDKRKRSIDLELAEIEPQVQAAKSAVGSIKPESLSEIRALRAPPNVIRDILEGVLRLMGIFDTSWVSMKSFLAKRGIKEDIANFNARNISAEIRAGVEELLDRNSASFDPHNAKRASVAAAPLAQWVKANVMYSHALEKIGPLEAEQNHLKKNLQKAMAKMEKLQKGLEDVDRRVEEYKRKFQKLNEEATKLKLELEKEQETIQTAENLIGKLDGEYQRWSTQVTELQTDLETLPKKAQIAAGFITYLSSAPEDERRAKLNSWAELAGLEKFDMRRFLSTESEQLIWKGEGLPSDDLSMENAVVILQINNLPVASSLRPFLVDPSSRATEWLKTHLKEARLEVVNQQDANFTTALELAVRFGKTLLIQEMDGIEPILFPLLRADLVSQGPRFVIQIGDKVIDYNEDFRLFMTTRNPNPEIPPDAASIISEVNFTITRAGLTGQLLANTIQHEKPELEVRKTELLKQEEDLKIQLAELEESLLETLAKSEGNILENKALLESLNKTKESSQTISNSLEESVNLQASLDQERSAYLPLAENGSTLFFVISDLAKLNNMYRFSLGAFLRLFLRALEGRTDGSSTEMRIQKLGISLQNLIYEYVCRSLFKADRLMFALHLVHGMHAHHFKENEWEAFLGQIVSDVKSDASKSRDALPSWIDQDRVQAVSVLKSNFTQLYQNLSLSDSSLWSSFSRSSQCEQEFPSSLDKKISPFQQTLVVQALRPDRLQSSMAMFACRVLGMKELSPPTLNLKRLCQETVPTEPILVIISPGADPSQELQELANEVIGAEKYHQVAMGQGQANIAMQLLHDCARNGEWLCLKNLHLVTSWLPVLEKEINTLEPHEKFRLWLTAESHPKFPTILLQSSLKITYEAPPGIKKNLLRSYESWSPEFISKDNNTIRAQALFALAWFHAVCQERRNFIPQGWTKFYEFSLSDLRAGADIINRLSKSKSKEMKWDFIHGLFENAIYGGRVDNPFDMRVLRSYLSQYFNKDTLTGGGSRKPKKIASGVSVPSSAYYREYTDMIKSFPEDDKPSYFGLPANIERSSQRIISSQVISQLKILRRLDETAVKFDIDRWNTELGPILNLWKKLNQGSQLIQMKLQPPSEKSGNSESPVTSFIQLERYNAITLVQFVHSTLAALSKVIRGTTLLTSEVQKLASLLLKQETPLDWLSRWDGPEDPIQYLRTLVARTMAIQGWVQKTESRSLLNETLDLSELFHPDTFLNALRQQTARDIKTSMDNLKFVCRWGGSISGARHQVKIGGLQLEGCTFDGSRLSENQRDSPSVCTVPTCTVAWVLKDSSEPYGPEESISLPVYYSSDREKIVTHLAVPCGGDQEHWVQTGAALFLKSL